MATNNAINNAGNSFLVPANNLSDLTAKATANNNLNAILAINAVTNVGNVDWGKTIVCTGTGYPLTITGSHVANQWMRISVQTTSNGMISLSSAIGGTFNGQSTILLGSGDCITLWDDGTNYWIIAEHLQPVHFTAYRNANQSITTGSNQAIVFNVAATNVGGYFNTATGRFTPLTAGLYRFNWSAIFAVGSSAYTQVIKPFLNAANQVSQNNFIPTTVGQNSSISSSQIQYMNGTTDFFEIYAFQNSGGSINITGDATPTYQTMFSGERIALF